MRFIVSGKSMSPKYNEGDKLFVSRLIYKLAKPKVGDVVVLTDPRTDRLILKKIESAYDSKYFVAGENPSESTDSRVFGSVDTGQIVGKVLFRYNKSR